MSEPPDHAFFLIPLRQRTLHDEIIPDVHVGICLLLMCIVVGIAFYVHKSFKKYQASKIRFYIDLYDSSGLTNIRMINQLGPDISSTWSDTRGSTTKRNDEQIQMSAMKQTQISKSQT